MVSFPRSSYQEIIRTSPVTHTCHMSRPSHSSLFGHSNNILWELRLMNLLIMLPPPLIPAYLIQLRPECLSQHHFLEHLNLFPHLNVSNNFHTRVKQPAKLNFWVCGHNWVKIATEEKNTKELRIFLSVSIRTWHFAYRSINHYGVIVCLVTRLTLHHKCSSSTDSSSCRTSSDWSKRLTPEFL